MKETKVKDLNFYKKCMEEKKSVMVSFHQIDKEEQKYVTHCDGFKLVMPLRMLISIKDNDTDMLWNTPVIGKRLSEEIEVFITDVDEKTGVVTCSRDFVRAQLREKEKAEIEEFLKNKKKGEKYVIKGRVSKIFGEGGRSCARLITEGGLRLLLYCSYYGYEYIADIRDRVRLGDEIDVAVLKPDDVEDASCDYIVSRRDLLPSPWENLDKKLKKGDVVVAHVTGRRKGAMSARIEGYDGINALVFFPDKDKNLLVTIGGRYQCEVHRVKMDPPSLIVKPFAEKL